MISVETPNCSFVILRIINITLNRRIACLAPKTPEPLDGKLLSCSRGSAARGSGPARFVRAVISGPDR